MIRSAYRDLSQAIKLESKGYRNYNISYYPLTGKNDYILLASVSSYSEESKTIDLYSDNIQEVMGTEQEICKLIAKLINKACKELNIKVPRITIGYFPIGYRPLDKRAGSYRIQYYSKLYKEWFINDYYSTKEEENNDYALAIGVKFKPYHRPDREITSYRNIYWTDVFYSVTGMAYLPVRDITPQVAKDILLYQVENNIEPSKFMKTKLDEEGKEVLDTVNNLLTIKGVA
ncbi:MAG TPA: hypothetical protein PLS98_09020 [Dictyoglomaceae bacterium]|nr:hypothetical protein [Dictyoglomaceae bacterium]